jgi:hypothetical protein
MSHAMAHLAGIGAYGLWSVSRGLARGLESRSEYKQMMDYADMPRQNDLDGRGNLSLHALKEFTQWFLKVCLDQVTFMSGLFEIEALAAGFRKYVAQSDTLKPESSRLLQEALMRGEYDRGEAARITGLPERSARRVLNDLVVEGLLASATLKGPVSLRFPTNSLEIIFPGSMCRLRFIELSVSLKKCTALVPPGRPFVRFRRFQRMRPLPGRSGISLPRIKMIRYVQKLASISLVLLERHPTQDELSPGCAGVADFAEICRILTS